MNNTNKEKTFYYKKWKWLILHVYVFSVFAVLTSIWGKRIINEHHAFPYLSYNGGLIACIFDAVIIIFNIPFYIYNYYYLKKINVSLRGWNFWIGFFPVCVSFIILIGILFYYKGY